MGMRKILVTGAAGFIGFHLSQRFLDSGDAVVGIDNLNDYYDVTLKESRLARLENHRRFRFIRMDLADREGIAALFKKEAFELVVHLAAQAGSAIPSSILMPISTVIWWVHQYPGRLSGSRKFYIWFLPRRAPFTAPTP